MPSKNTASNVAEHCPLSSGSAPGFRYGGEFPPECLKTCEQLWDAAVSSGVGEFEVYPDHLLIDEGDNCEHPSTEYSHDALQALAIGSATRIYTIVDHCTTCETEVSETAYTFKCPKP